MNSVRALAVLLPLSMWGCDANTPVERLAACASAGPFTLQKSRQSEAAVECHLPAGVVVIALPRGNTDASTLRAAGVNDDMAELLGVGSKARDDSFCVDTGRDPADPDVISRFECISVDFAIPRVMLIEGNVRLRFVAVPNEKPQLEQVTLGPVLDPGAWRDGR